MTPADTRFVGQGSAGVEAALVASDARFVCERAASVMAALVPADARLICEGSTVMVMVESMVVIMVVVVIVVVVVIMVMVAKEVVSPCARVGGCVCVERLGHHRRQQQHQPCPPVHGCSLQDEEQIQGRQSAT